MTAFILFILYFLCFILYFLQESKALQLPETYLSTPELIEYWGYPAETHEAVTEDGYILTLHRIPAGKVPDGNRTRSAFLVMHPLLSSSSDWVINLPHQSLGFVLADKGYDVWLGNVRGNTYSKKHLRLKVNSKAFWDFSVDEHAKYDLPAMINYILNTTGQSKLFYVGYSQGSLMAFAGLSENKELQSKIGLYFALAPVSRIANINTAVTTIASWEGKLEFIFSLFGVEEFYPSSNWGKVLQKYICWWLPSVCKKIMFIISGTDRKYLNETRLPIYVAHTPAGTSVKNMWHYFQLVNSKSFRKYDYGEYENIEHYSSKVPPEYNITKVEIPTVIISGSHDTLSPPKDVEWTVKHLTNVVQRFEIKGYNHLDFMWGTNADTALNEKIVKIARETENALD